MILTKKQFEMSNVNVDSSAFIEFMLKAIKTALENVSTTSDVGINVGSSVGINLEDRVLSELRKNPKLTARKLAEITGASSRQIERLFSRLKNLGMLERIGSNKSGEWIVKK